MTRRRFIHAAAASLAGAAVAAPAIAQGNPTINWRLASSFPKSLDTIFGAADVFSKRVAALTDGKFEIRSFAGGEIVPAMDRGLLVTSSYNEGFLARATLTDLRTLKGWDIRPDHAKVILYFVEVVLLFVCIGIAQFIDRVQRG